MPASQRGFPRARRVAHLLQTEIAALLPHLHGLDVGGLLPSITEVELAPDMRWARVHFSLMDGPARAETTAAELDRHAGQIRQMLGRRLALRRIPPLRFVYDPRFDRDAQMARLLSSLPPAAQEDAPE
ncbi:30S ribosome-binding factor RbfA [Acidithiobacillus sp.]|uniref:30S ribosome-binding factor RbfA n=1 Tax=Acidithiobacillus sp. TaxID=1872118 RepID=UPI0025C193D1|nr:30S ribosome-binding factor RbfA [Acidithiobacillus sp.]